MGMCLLALLCAGIAGSCNLCEAGAYQTGSGQLWSIDIERSVYLADAHKDMLLHAAIYTEFLCGFYTVF
jgi:hypothetical protein